MIWSRREIIGALIFAGMALVLVLKPEVAIPGNQPFSPLGASIIRDMGLSNLDCSPGELDADLHLIPQHLMLVDIRSTTEFEHFHIPGAINISFNDLLSKRGPICGLGVRIICYDTAGFEGRAAQAAILLRMGSCNAYWLRGGFVAWLNEHDYNKAEALPLARLELLMAEFATYGLRQDDGSTSGKSISSGQSDTNPVSPLPAVKRHGGEGC